MKRRLIIIFIIVMTAAESCVYRFNPQIDGKGGYMIVDGDIIIGEISKVRLGYSWSLVDTLLSQNEEQMQILNQSKMHIEDNRGGHYDNIQQGARSSVGYFDMREADPSLEYRLVIENANGKYVSSWGKSIAPGQIDSLSFQISSDFNTMSIQVSAHSSDPVPSYYRWKVEETWEYHARERAIYKYIYTGGPDGKVVPLPDSESVFRCWLSDSRSEIMTASTQDLTENRLGKHRLYTIGNRDQRISVCYQPKVTQMRIPEEEYRYWEQLNTNGDDVGGLLSPEPTEMRGNMVNLDNPNELVLGYVSVVSVTRATFYVKNQLTRFYRRTAWPQEAKELLNNPIDYLRAHKYGKWPVKDVLSDNGVWLGYEWWPDYCVDCRLEGGTTKHPPGWPLYFDNK